MDLIIRVPNPWPGASVFVKERTRSTMDDVLDLARRGYPTGTAVVAGFQEKGRGRVPGRTWVSAPWESLLVSFLISPSDLSFPPRQLPLRVAVGVARAVDPLLPGPARIKWPNDVVTGGKKLAGVLCEGRGGFFLVGVGINCGQKDFPPELRDRATSLLAAGGAAPQAFELCGVVLKEMRRALEDEGWPAEIGARLDGKGKTITVKASGGIKEVRGIVEGVDAEGALILLEEGGGRVTVSQGEIIRSR